MKKLFTLFLFALLAITSAWAADDLFYTLQCVYNKSNSGYATYNDVTIEKMTWNAPGNQTLGNYWRFGASSALKDATNRSITGKSKMGAEISKITVTHKGVSSDKVHINFVKVTVSSDANFSNIIDEVSVTPTVSKSTAGSFDIAPNAEKKWASNAFYKIDFNISLTAKGGIDVEKIEFFKSSTPTTPGKTATSLSFGADWDGNEITKYIGEKEFPCPTATLTPAVEGATITYTSDNENVAAIVNGTIMLGDAEGKAIIKASYAGDETHEASSASFTIDLQKLPDPTFSPAPGAVVAGTVVTIKAPIDGATIDVSYEPEGEATVNVKDVAETTITISKPTYIIAQTVYNGIKSDGVEANYTINELTGDTYTLVTSDKDLESGAKYVLVNQAGDKIASAFSTNKITTVESTDNYDLDTDNNIVTVLSDKVNVFTFTGDATNGWTITDKDDVVYTSSNKNELSSGTATVHTISISKDGTVKISAKSYPSRQWEFNSGIIRNYSSGTGSAPYLYKSNAQVVVKPAAPTFDPESGTAFDTETATVTITAPKGCTLKYTVGSGAEQTSTTNTATVTVSPTAYTITAKSVDAEDVESNEATATYTFNVVAHVKNIAEFLALPDNTTAIFDNPVVVLYDYSQPGSQEYIWVKDETGHTQIFVEPAFDASTTVARYENGDVIPAGFKVTKFFYEKGQFVEALVNTTDEIESFEDAKQKRLADPVTITFDEFNALVATNDNHIAKWCNTYVMIPRVKTSINKSNTYDKKYYVKQTQKVDETETTTTSANVFYNKYSDDGAKKKDGSTAVVSMPKDETVEYNVYGILQIYNDKTDGKIWEIMPIRFVPYSEQTVTLKELVELGKAGSTDVNTVYTILNDLRGVRALPDGALPDRVILAKDENGNAVDKVTPAGNSFMINAKSKFDDAATEESVNAKAQEDYDQSNWVEIVLPEGVSAADYVDKIITGLSVKGNYTDTTNPRLVATAAPTAGGKTGAYTRNAMCPANFMGTSQKCNDKVQNHGDFFFMTPKPNECVQVVWAVYNSYADAFYIPAASGSINSHGFVGAFSIDWTYNAGGKKTLEDATTYQFAAVVKKTVVKKEPEAQSSTKRKVAYDNGQELSKDYVVYPLNLDANTVTGITETTGAKTVKSVRYFNIMGVELAEPTAGVNIVLTTYTDGTTHSQKILK